MLIDFAPDGSVQYTRNRDLDALFADQRRRVERMTEIKFADHFQLYWIRFITGQYKNSAIAWKGSPTGGMVSMLLGDHSPYLQPKVVRIPTAHVCYFRTYEDAVEFEIAFVELMRERGIPVT